MKKGNINKGEGRREKRKGGEKNNQFAREKRRGRRGEEKKNSRDVRTSDLRVLKLGRCSPG